MTLIRNVSTAAMTFGLLLGGCGGGAEGQHAEHGEASAQYAGDIGSADVAAGEQTYQAACLSCHGSGAPDLDNIGWTPAAMRQQIREGSGNMPALRESRISDADMEAVLAYMTTIGGVEGALPEGAAPAAAGEPEQADSTVGHPARGPRVGTGGNRELPAQ